MMTDQEASALRRVVRLCWQGREKLDLRTADVEQLLISWIVVGEGDEIQFASETLAAIRAAAAKQASFDRFLDEHGAKGPSK